MVIDIAKVQLWPKQNDDPRKCFPEPPRTLDGRLGRAGGYISITLGKIRIFMKMHHIIRNLHQTRHICNCLTHRCLCTIQKGGNENRLLLPSKGAKEYSQTTSHCPTLVGKQRALLRRTLFRSTFHEASHHLFLLKNAWQEHMPPSSAVLLIDCSLRFQGSQ